MHVTMFEYFFDKYGKGFILLQHFSHVLSDDYLHTRGPEISYGKGYRCRLLLVK